MVDLNIDFQDLTYDNMASWPMPIKVACIILIMVAIIGMGYWLDTSNQLLELERVEKKELSLKKEFETKHKQATNLVAYQQQLVTMQNMFKNMLQQLPSKSEIPALLEDISETGVEAGLRFRLFDPLRETQADFYVEMPIHMSVIGNYHQLATFVSNIAALDRIVTLHDFEIKPFKASSASSSSRRKVSPDDLVMDITAKIYRYTSDSTASNSAKGGKP